MELEKLHKSTINPLVSIIVIAYNSAKFVLETLESAKVQTYQNIELIISDDCSTDNTMDICRNWIAENKSRFVCTKLITTPVNRGIPANCNRGIKASRGEWVKLIAGDDILKYDCIEILVKFIIENYYRNVKFVFSLQQHFLETFHNKNFLDIHPIVDDHVLYSPDSTAIEQYKSLLRLEKYIPGPAIFFNKKLFEDVGGFIEKYPLLDDFPFFLRILESGNKIFFVNEITVYYRENSLSVTKKDVKTKVITDLDISWNKYLRDYVFYRVSFIRRLNILWTILLMRLVFVLGNEGVLTRKIYYLGLKVQPIRLLWFKKLFKIALKASTLAYFQ